MSPGWGMSIPAGTETQPASALPPPGSKLGVASGFTLFKTQPYKKKSGAAVAFMSAPCRGVIPNQPGKLLRGFSCLALQSKPGLFLAKRGCDQVRRFPVEVLGRRMPVPAAGRWDAAPRGCFGAVSRWVTGPRPRCPLHGTKSSP